VEPPAVHATRNTEHDAYLRGIELFNARQFWESHEAWEEIWLVVEGVESDFYQGLIQSAAALLKFQRGEFEPARRLYALAKEKLCHCPAEFMRLNVREFQACMAECFAPILDGRTGTIDESKIPTLTLNPA
jgi:predicted metal-dependent hydrolase